MSRGEGMDRLRFEAMNSMCLRVFRIGFSRLKDWLRV